MDNQLQSISKIFTEKLYRIPDYQRGYAWGEKQLKDFWNDLIQLEDGKNHYVGVLTLEKVPLKNSENWPDDQWIINSKSFEPLYIVDGQQRLTTTVILIQCIIEIAKEKKIKDLNFTKRDEIAKKYICDTPQKGISSSFIFGYEKDNPSYEFLKNKILDYFSSGGYNNEETIYTSNLQFAKLFFKERLTHLTINEIETAFTKVTQKLLFNIYTISSEVDVFVAFETMNNRGKPLSNLELLKNRLIFLSTKLDISDDEKNKLRRGINDCWKSIYHYLGKNKDNPLNDDVFLQNHFMIYFASKINPKEEGAESFYKEFTLSGNYIDYLLESYFSQKNITDGGNHHVSLADINNYVQNLQISVQIWFDLNNPLQAKRFDDKEKFWLEKLSRLQLDDLQTLLLYLYSNYMNSFDYVQLLKFIEQVEFGRIFTYDRRHFRYNHRYNYEYLTIDNIRNRKSIDNIKDIIFKQFTEFQSGYIEEMTEIRNIFSSNGFYNWSGIKYFLFEYELSLKEKSKTKRSKINWNDFVKEYEDQATVEHILPQKFKPDSCWGYFLKEFKSDELKKIKNSLGNLVPLSKPKNSSLQNKCFLDKVDNGKDKVGYRYGSYSENELSKYTSWQAIDIFERGMKLLKFIELRWNLKLGDEKDKSKILGLDFLNTKVRK